MNYLVRQHRPAYVSGFENKVYRNIQRDEIANVPFCENFKGEGFTHFTVKPYGSELIISAHYANGEHWVVGFALPEDSDAPAPDGGGLLRDNWRYKDSHAVNL